MSRLDKLTFEFYNHEYKMAYLRQYETEDRFQSRISSMMIFSEYEFSHGKDLGDMTKDELLEMLSQYQISSYNMLLPRMVHLRGYLTWFSDNVHPLQAKVLNIAWRDVDLSSSFRNHMLFYSGQIASDWIEFPPEDGYYYQPVMVLAWCGVQLKDAVELLKEQVVDDGERITIMMDTPIVITDDVCVSILRSFRNAKPRVTVRRVWTPKDTNKFIYPMVSDKDKPDLTSQSISCNIYAVCARRSKLMISRYDVLSVLNAGRYRRIIEMENRIGRPANLDELLSMSGRKSLAKTQIDALRASVNAYRKAFDL